jgi:hypothetical protein
VVVTPVATAPDLAPRDLGTSDAPHLRLRLAPSAACGERIVLELVARFEDAAGTPFVRRLATRSFDIGLVGSAPCDPFTDPACTEPVERIGTLHGFEGPGDGGWSHGLMAGPSAAASDEWERAAPAGLGGDPPSAWEGVRAFGTDLEDDGLHGASLGQVLESPAWDASRHSRVRLRYARWLGVQGSEHDVARVVVGGQEIWRNASPGPLLDPSCADARGGRSTHSSDGQDMPEGPAGWKAVELDVSPIADHSPSVVARWELVTDGDCEHGGWTLDAVELVGVPDVSACRPHAPAWTSSGARPRESRIPPRSSRPRPSRACTSCA